MKRAFYSFLCGALLMFGVGCSSSVIVDRVQEIAENDLTRTSEMAAKYGKPEVKTCSDFLLARLQSEDSAQAKLDNLLKEPTKGLFSASLKAALVADLIRSLNDPASRAEFESEFRSKCSAVAGDILIRALRDARKVGSRGAF